MWLLKKLFTSIILIYSLCISLQAKDTSQELYLKYTNFPSVVYSQQRFTVELEARILTTDDDYYDIVTSFIGGKNIEILTDDISWLPQGNENKYTAKITYKAKNQAFELPTIKLALTQYDKDIEFIMLKPPKIKYYNIAINQEKFSNIIASDLQIKEVKVKQYNNNMLMVVTHIQTQNGNLEEFHLGTFKEQGVEHFEDHYPLQILYYYTVIPTHIDNIEFDYYNTKSKSFVTVQLPIILKEDLVSTQTNLNPHENDLLFYKQMGSLLFVLIFLLIYLKTKYKIFAILSLIFLILLGFLLIPNKIISLKKDTKIYILPTKLSTIYKITKKKSQVEVLMKRNNFIKVLFKNNTIGWVKQNDI